MGHVTGSQPPSLPSGRWLPNLGSSVISPSGSLERVCDGLWHLRKGCPFQNLPTSNHVDLPSNDEILVVSLLSNFRHHPINSSRKNRDALDVDVYHTKIC